MIKKNKILLLKRKGRIVSLVIFEDLSFLIFNIEIGK